MIEQITKSLDKLTGKFTTWIDQFVLMLPNFFMAMLVLVGFIIAARLIRKLSKKGLGKISENIAITSLLSNILYFAIVSIGIFVALGLLHLDKTVTSLLAGVGVIGLALGFAFQNTAANFISGLFMATKHPINVGDIVKSNDYFGTVKRIDLRFTEISTPQGQAVIIPNKTILESPLVNYTISGERRIDLTCGISYGEDLKRVKEIATQAIEDQVEYNKDKPVEFMFTGFGDSSINFILRYWTKTPSQTAYLLSQSEAIMSLKRAFDKNSIVIPFPIRTLDFGIKGGAKLNEMLPKSN